jgi:lathosterol oxidase
MISAEYVALYFKAYAQLVVGGMSLYFFVAGIQYLLWYKFKPDVYLKELDQSKTNPLQEIIYSVQSVVAMAVVTAFIRVELDRNSYLYYNISDHGWVYFFTSIVLILLVTEFLVYWVHRLEHDNRWLYNHWHYMHHEFIQITPFCGWAFHPLDSLSQALPMFIVPFVFPVHYNLHMFLTLLLAVWGILIHDNMSFWPNSWILYAAHHTIHHDTGRRKNYGQFLTVWDRIFGTYEHPASPMPFQGKLTNAKKTK